MGKRVISIIMALLMVLAVFPTNIALAEQNGSDSAAGWGRGQSGALSDWIPTGCTASSSLTLSMKNQGDPQITKSDLGIDASKYKKLELTYMNGTNNTGGQMYFILSGVTGGFQPQNGIGFSVEANTTEEKTVVIDCSGNANWAGMIDQIRFDPVNGGNDLTGTFTFISLKFITDDGSEDVIGWGRDQEGSLSDWISIGCTASSSLTLCMENQGDPQITKSGLGIEASKYKKLEMTYMNGTNNTGGQMYFILSGAGGGFQPQNGIGFEVEANTTEEKTVVIDCFGKNANWAGTIDQIRFDPVNGGNDLTGTFIVTSMRFIEEGVVEPTPGGSDAVAWGKNQGADLKSWTVGDATAVYEDDGSCTLSVTGFDTQIWNKDLNFDASEYQSMLLTYENHTSCTIGEAIFIRKELVQNGFQGNCTVQFELKPGANTVQIPFSSHANWKGLIGALRVDPVKDLKSGTFKIISMEMLKEAAPEVERPTSWDWDTDGDFQDWNCNHPVIRSSTVKDSGLILEIDGQDPNINGPVMNMDTTIFPTVEIVYKNETDNTSAELFWNNGGGINQACSTSFTTKNDGEWHTLRINLSKKANWVGKISGIRLDPIREGKGIFTIDSIRFLSTTNSDGQLAEAWEWRTDADSSGWKVINMPQPEVKNGRVMLTLDGRNDPGFQKESGVDIDAEVYKTLEITYKNHTNLTNAEFYWGDADGNWAAADGVHVQGFATINDGQWHTLRVSLKDIANWTGKITKLRVDPTGDGGTGTFEIDRIAILYDGVDNERYELSNGYFSLSGAKGMLDKLAFDPTGNGNYSEDLINGNLFMKMDASDVPYDAFSEEAVGTVNGTTLTISNIRFGDPAMIGTWTITLDGNKMRNEFKLDTQGQEVVLKNAGYVMDILWENNTNEIEGEEGAPGSLKVPFKKMVSASDRYHSAYAFQYMTTQEHVSVLGLEGEWIDWEGANGFPFNLRFETDTEFVSPVCSVDSLRYLFRNPDAKEEKVVGAFTRTMDVTVSESKDVTPAHYVRYEVDADSNHVIAKALNDMTYEFGYAREPASTQPDWWEWVSLTRAWRNDNYLQPDMDKVNAVRQITEADFVEGDPGVGYIYTWNDLKGWPFPSDKDANHYLMSTANYINAMYNYFIYNGDWEFLNENIAKMRLGMDYLLTKYDDESQLFLIDHPDHNGVADLSDNVGGLTDPTRRADSVGSNYWDITPYGYKSAYDNLYCYIALNRMAEIEEMLNAPVRAAELKKYAADLKEGYNQAFWTGDHYIQTIDVTGAEHDYGCVYLNLEAINYGIADAEQARKAMDYMDTTVTDSGSADTFKRYDYAPRVTMKDNQYWYVYQYGNPGEYGGKQLQNGGANFYTMYYELMSWIKAGNTKRAYERLQLLVDAFNENEHLQGKKVMYDGSINQYGGEGSVGIWGDFPESGLVPQAAKDGFMGINADKDGLKVTPNMPTEIPELSLDGIDYWGLGLRVTASNTSVTIEATKNTSKYDWAVNGKKVSKDANGLFSVKVDIAKGDTVLLSRDSGSGIKAPIITGIENGKTYCQAQTVTVTDEDLKTVTLNEKIVTLDTNNQFVVTYKEGVQVIEATDEAGNRTTYRITVNKEHDFELKNYKAPARDEDGYSGDRVCKNCGFTIKGTVLKAIGTAPEGNGDSSQAGGGNDVNKGVRTGDDNRMALWILLMGLSGCAVAAGYVSIYRKKCIRKK